MYRRQAAAARKNEATNGNGNGDGGGGDLSNRGSGGRQPRGGGSSSKKQQQQRSTANAVKTGLILAFLLVGMYFKLSSLYGKLFRWRPTNSSSSSSSKMRAGGTGRDNSTTAAKTAAADPPPASKKAEAAAAVQALWNEFYERYGGKRDAVAMLERGVRAFGEKEKTAERLLRAAANDRPFVLSFAGYSVTVGRGNYLKQSFPFVLERVLNPLFGKLQASSPSSSSLGIPSSVVVRNAAIGGIPSFPYGFCFEHFLGVDSDVISWDYSMNEKGNDASVLESYLRQSQSQLSQTHPMVIVLDTNKKRCELLRAYAQRGLIRDALCVGMAKDVLDKPLLQELKDANEEELKKKPAGFQNWNDFGAPKACPGKGSWHPKLKEHELVGWMMAMYFVEAVELALQTAEKNPNWRQLYGSTDDPPVVFPPPLAGKRPDNDPQVARLLYGHNDDKSDQYTMKHLSCRTSFLPAIDQDKVIPSVVVSGWNENEGTDNILDDRSDDAYRDGWVLDVSQIERDTKRKVEGKGCGGLGYVDMKIALYGIQESGPLRLWLPAKNTAGLERDDDHRSDASYWFSSLVFCEANEKRPKEACQLDADIEYKVGGVLAKSVKTIAGAAEYLKRRTCVHVAIPDTAKVTTLFDLRSIDKKNGGNDSTSPLTEQLKTRLSTGGANKMDENAAVGLVVDVHITREVTRKDGACCISHIVWENNR